MLTPYGPGGLLVSSPGLLNQFSGVFPHQGSSGGGTLVTLIGSHFSNATAVYFGSRPAAGFAVLDDQTIIAVTPAGSGAVPVTVTTPGGTARIGYFYYLYWPALSAVTPAAGPVGGGNVVELRGINLSTARLVHFGDAVAHPVVLSDARLLVIAPPVAGPGTVPVYVSSIGGVSNRLPYTYAAAPSVTGVIPATGPIAGGSTVILTGTGLSLVTGVSFGALSATSFRAFSDTLIVAVTPAGPPGPADVTVTTPGGSVTVPAAFDYRAPSATAVTSTPDPALVGQPVTFTATVTGVPPTSGTPSGTVTFDFGDGTAVVTAAVTNGAATASHAYTGPSGTPYAVIAGYSGDDDFTASTGTDTQVVEAAPTTTTVTSAPDPSAVGQSVTFVARVAVAPPGAGVPTGTVTFDFGDGTPQISLPVSSGAASVTHAYPNAAANPYPVTATYSGDANFTTSTGTDTQAVQQAATATTVGLDPDPSVTGQPVTVTATVGALPPGAGTPTGTVTFSFGDGTATTTHTYTGTAGSPYALTATYNGSTNFTASSGSDTQTVSKAATTTTVSSAPDPSAAGQTVTLTAAVSALVPGVGTPTGTVTFSFGDGTSSATATLSGGVATVTHAYATPTGSPFTVTATYSGDASFTASSGTDSQTVNKAATTTTVVSSPNPSTTGDRVTVTATVAPVAPGAGSPTGTVTLAVTGRTPQTVPLVGGTATTSFNPLPKGSHTVTAQYNGDVSFAASTGSTVQTVP